MSDDKFETWWVRDGLNMPYRPIKMSPEDIARYERRQDRGMWVFVAMMWATLIITPIIMLITGIL